MPGDDDASLIAAIARDGDRAAFEAFYDRHVRMVYGLACRFLGQGGESEDLVQVVFLYVWEHAGGFDPGRGSAAAWLTVVTRSRCLDRLRGRRRRKDRPVDSGFLESLAGAGPGRGDPDVGRVLAEALGRLPEGQREAVETVYFKGLTQAETAALLGLPLGTVKSRIRLAMESLAEILGPGGASHEP